MTDALTYEGATRLAAAIEAYWRNLGFIVRAHVVEQTGPGRAKGACGVRSDMVNGYPVRRSK